MYFMKKLLSLLLLLFVSMSLYANAETVVLAYTGTTTTNMTGENDAAIVGLDATEWSVIGNLAGNDLYPGLNKAGEVRLYWNENGVSTIDVASLNNATINNITFEFSSANYSNVYVEVNGNIVEPNDEGEYAINASAFTIGNNNTTNVQVRIKSITINYTPYTPPTGITNVESSVKKVQYYNMQGVQSSEPFDGVNIVTIEYDNGTKKINKVIKK